ncbi:MAG TPA: NAD(P)H-hydrate dehydratase [Chitinophagaceae bacterium]|nr:NAD(P)H-hydrate dehydratase [Chitinophagaceae bacterium]
MKILSAEEIKAWDQFTMQYEPVSSIGLMERAALQCADWLNRNYFTEKHFIIFCGRGNNGGDGLALALLLKERKETITIYIIEAGNKGSNDFKTNLTRLQQSHGIEIHFIQSEADFPDIPPGTIIIDALFGSGLNRRLEGMTATLVNHINSSGSEIISIDIPSGLFVDRSSNGNTIIRATHTLSFQCYKLAFLVAENAQYIGEVHILDIGLHPEFYRSVTATYEIIDAGIVHSVYKLRNRFAHKGNFGHALLIAGSYGKMGAAVLSAKACLRSGAGLLSCHIPKCGYEILQTALPEAMVITDFNSSIITKIAKDVLKYDAIGIGPGIGTATETRIALNELLSTFWKPIIIDADGLNCLTIEKHLLHLLPAESILTPHPKEFERLFGESANDFDRLQLAVLKAKELNAVIVLKGHHSFIATPGGKGYFNNTGNAGMATAGSGDVLTGILTGLMAQGYSSVEAAILGVYLHGLAGDMAAKKLSQEAMIASDIIENLGEAFSQLRITYKIILEK